MKTSINVMTCGIITVMVLAFCAPKSGAYPTYSQARDATNCRACHGSFFGGHFALSDGANWSGGLMDTHSSTMLNSDCNTCHSSGGKFPVAIGSSRGGTGLAPIGCVGCHGREEDGGNDFVSPGRGAGLRQHHWNTGTRVCANCHSDADPANYTPVGEDVPPPYYFALDSSHPNKPTDSCSPNGEELYVSPVEGLDNDGDGLYDANDPDCAAAVCGDGFVDAGEDCDDGNTLDGDCCSANCTFEAAGSSCADGDLCNGDETCDGAGFCQIGVPLFCDDGLFCNGVETCDAAFGCQTGTAVNCDDGVACTDDSCNESTDTCDNVANNANCDDGLACNGAETCSMTLDCQSATAVDCNDGVACTVDSCTEPGGTCVNAPDDAACDDGLFCNGAETCDTAFDCQTGTTVDCNDGVGCTDDSCNEATNSCDNVANDANCDDGLFCNGAETCDAALDCQTGTTIDCNDGVGCTDDSCNEATNSCDNVANDANCDDGLFCNGAETCDAALDCQAGADPCPGQACDDVGDVCVNCVADADCDDALFCNGIETCVAGNCQSGTAVDCNDGVGCTDDSCNETTDACDNVPDDAACDDGLFCNGTETCDAVFDCQAGTVVNCDDGVGCTDDSCNEVTDACDNVANELNCPDDGLFCNGIEFCDAVADCSSRGDPCAANEVCNEGAGICDPIAVCGNGLLEPGEECDDGNSVSGDGCSANCTIEFPPTSGEVLYNQNCAFCHGDFDQDPPGAPMKVLGARTCSIEGAIYGTAGFPNGVPAMQFLQGAFDLEQTLAISDYLNSQPVTGRQRYVTACAGCHGNDAMSGWVHEDIRGEDAKEVAEAVFDEEEMVFLSCLSDSDISTIAAYLASLGGDDDDDHGDDDHGDGDHGDGDHGDGDHGDDHHGDHDRGHHGNGEHDRGVKSDDGVHEHSDQPRHSSLSSRARAKKRR